MEGHNVLHELRGRTVPSMEGQEKAAYEAGTDTGYVRRKQQLF